MSKPKILLTGGAGFIGSQVAQELADYDLTIVDNLKTGKLENVPKSCTFIQMNCADIKELGTYDAVVHIAGQASKENSFDDVFYDLDANSKSTLALLEMCRMTGCKRFIFISTVCVYGCGPGQFSETSPVSFDSFYSVNKYQSEQYIKLYRDIDFTIFRLFTCYGPGQDISNPKQGMVGIFMGQYLNQDHSIHVRGSLDRFRDFIYVKDVARIIKMSLWDKRFYSELFNLGSGIKTTVKELLNVLQNVTGKIKEIKVLDDIKGDMYGCYADNSKLRSLLPEFQFTILTDGCKEFFSLL
jgi:UDP-glucose 4-epimerase